MGRFHFEKSKSFEGVKVIGAYDTDREKREDARQKGLDVYGELATFLSAEMDAVIVPSR